MFYKNILEVTRYLLSSVSTLPVLTATPERTFSSLSRTKTYLFLLNNLQVLIVYSI